MRKSGLYVGPSIVFQTKADIDVIQRKFNDFLGGTSDDIFGIVGDLGIPRPVEPAFNSAFVLGAAFLERFYSVYDTAHNQIGLATTQFTFAETN